MSESAKKCHDCPNPTREGMATCQACADRHSARRTRVHRERKEAGLCVHCGKKPPMPGKVRCLLCLAGIADAQRRVHIRARRKYAAAGTCRACRVAPVEPGRTCCRPCLDVAKERDRARREALKAAKAAKAVPEEVTS